MIRSVSLNSLRISTISKLPGDRPIKDMKSQLTILRSLRQISSSRLWLVCLLVAFKFEALLLGEVERRGPYLLLVVQVILLLWSQIVPALPLEVWHHLHLGWLDVVAVVASGAS